MSQSRYLGGGSVVMQQLLMDVTDRSFPELMRSSLLEPLGPCLQRQDERWMASVTSLPDPDDLVSATPGLSLPLDLRHGHGDLISERGRSRATPQSGAGGSAAQA